MTAPVVLIGVGNEWRGDDGVGWRVAETAAQFLDGQVDVALCDGEPARLIDLWSSRALAIVVDATHGGGQPGHVHVWDGDVPGRSRRSAASHALGIDHAIALGAALDRLPSRLVVIGIEAGETGHGDALSPAVAAAVQPAVDTVVELVQAGSSATSSLR